MRSQILRVMIKRMFLVAFIAVSIFACKDDKATEKALLNEVIKAHDEVMGKEDYLMRNKMKIDTILSASPASGNYTVEDKATMSAVRSKLIGAEVAMSAWMQHFDAELKGKSHQEKIAYYSEQKKIVLKIDSQMKAAIEGSDKYLKEIKK